MQRDLARVNPYAPLGPERQHYWRVLRMGRATGTDLTKAMATGRISQADWAAIVTRCRGCKWCEGCTRWLDQPTEDIRAVPEGCRNAATFAGLRAAQQDRVS